MLSAQDAPAVFGFPARSGAESPAHASQILEAPLHYFLSFTRRSSIHTTTATRPNHTQTRSILLHLYPPQNVDASSCPTLGANGIYHCHCCDRRYLRSTTSLFSAV